MTDRDRIYAMCCGDETSVALTLELLARPSLERVRLLRENGGTPTTVLPEQPYSCPNCLREWPEAFCDECGQQLVREAPLRGARAEKGRDV